ncbi:MAG TPA: ABC transporter C-terminal domain-containing protein, partial [Tetrasphaera sp.]
SAPGPAAAGATGSSTASEPGGRGVSPPAANPAQQREARKNLARIERQLQRLTEKAGRIHTDMAAQASDHAAMVRLSADLRAVDTEREALEEDWLAQAELAE